MSIYKIYFSNFGRPPILDDLCKDSAPRHPRFWRRRFLKVFTIYGHGGHFGQWTATILALFSFSQPKEAPYEIWAKLAQGFQRRSRLKMLTDWRTDDGRKVITIAHLEHSSGELKTKLLDSDIYVTVTYIYFEVKLPVILTHNQKVSLYNNYCSRYKITGLWSRSLWPTFILMSNVGWYWRKI